MIKNLPGQNPPARTGAILLTKILVKPIKNVCNFQPADFPCDVKSKRVERFDRV
jgi:hypothetical protein